MKQTRATNETIRGFAPESISSDTKHERACPGHARIWAFYLTPKSDNLILHSKSSII